MTREQMIAHLTLHGCEPYLAAPDSHVVVRGMRELFDLDDRPSVHDWRSYSVAIQEYARLEDWDLFTLEELRVVVIKLAMGEL